VSLVTGLVLEEALDASMVVESGGSFFVGSSGSGVVLEITTQIDLSRGFEKRGER
jgi:hypothetical protein